MGGKLMLKLVPPTPTAHTTDLIVQLFDIASRAEAEGWTVNFATEAEAGAARLTLSIAREQPSEVKP